MFFMSLFKVHGTTLSKMECEQHSPELKWHKLSCVALYVEFDGFQLLSADRYVLRANK